MKSIFLSKIRESIISILPISIVIMVLSLIFIPNCGWSMLAFGISTILLMIGICLFSMGNDLSLMKMGGYIGSHLSKTKKVALMLICSFIIGVIVTIAESDLSLLASQVPGINNYVFIITVGVGVGFFLFLAALRILLNIRIKYVLAVAYSIIFILMFFVPKTFLPIAFDASGVTTGALSVPFIMAFGLGISAVRSGEHNQDDGFGLLAMCSIGPIFAVMLMSAILGNMGTTIPAQDVVTYTNFVGIAKEFGLQIIENLKEVALILIPIVAFFMIYNWSLLKLPKQAIARLFVGVAYTYIGIVLFFMGAKCGFMPLANALSTNIYSISPYLLIPICAVTGLFIVMAEPAIHVLNRQVEELSSGTIKQKTMLITLSIGVSLAILLSALRILFEINMLILLAPMIVAMIALTFVISNKITAIAFDSGGVTAGVISSTFILPFMHGICLAQNLDLMTYGFGTIGIIILVPILIVEIMGVKMAINERKIAKIEQALDQKEKHVTIIEFD